MNILIIIGAVTTILGIAGLAYCIREAARVRSGSVPADQTTEKLRGLIAINLAAVGVASIGLGMVIVGVIL